MVEVNTRLFGMIQIEDNRVIKFEKGILGFPDLKRFTLIYDADQGKTVNIKWLQSLEEPGFALPVMDPDIVVEGYAPEFDKDYLSPLGGNLDPDNILMENENSFDLITSIKNKLSKNENIIFDLRLKGLHNEEIAELISKDKKYVENTMFRINKKYKELFK